jgi:hypothetical protein
VPVPSVSFRRAASIAAVSLAAALVAACGGGGGGGAAASSPAAVGVSSSAAFFAAADSVANVCTDEGQKQWVRSFLHETYLWHDEIRDVPAASYATPNAYFDALLVKTADANGVVKDRFSLSMSAPAANLMQGVAAAASAPSASAADPVPLWKTLTSAAGRRVGYILFNEHKQGAQDKLVAAVTQLRDGAVQDLVLDLRYNAGGFLYVAQAIGAMVAGPAIDGQVYQRLLYSDKRAASNETMLFSTRVTTAETSTTAGMPLPQLDLPRLYVLTSKLTCSASETIINSLRGAGVKVVLVGDRTCGKPYGFHRKDNCGQSYFPVEFRVANALGFSDYSAGLPVQCKVAEDPRRPLGDASEPLLSAALRHIDTGSCPATGGSVTGVTVEQASPSPLEREGAPAADSPMYRQGFDGLLR